MAKLIEVYCCVCGKSRYEVAHPSGICGSCRREMNDRDKRMHLASLKGLTIEERLELMEESLYNLSKRPTITHEPTC
jgi:hypothetical protein